MEQPPGFSNPQTPCFLCELHKTLYGLKQAPSAWFEKLHGTLISFGFVLAKSFQSLFFKITPQYSIFLLVYVDDILSTGSDKLAVTTLIQSLDKAFDLRNLDHISYFLGIQIRSLPNGGFHLSQQKYITNLLIRAKL